MADGRQVSVIKWFVGFTLALHVLAGAWSANRAWTQVRRLELTADPELRAGSRPRVDVVSSGRGPVTVYLTLTRSGRTDTLAVHTVAGRRDGFWDPRFVFRTFAPAVTATQLARFGAGPAVLRAEGRGRKQWLREPPPVVREVPVRVAPS